MYIEKAENKLQFKKINTQIWMYTQDKYSGQYAKNSIQDKYSGQYAENNFWYCFI